MQQKLIMNSFEHGNAALRAFVKVSRDHEKSKGSTASNPKIRQETKTDGKVIVVTHTPDPRELIKPPKAMIKPSEIVVGKA